MSNLNEKLIDRKSLYRSNTKLNICLSFIILLLTLNILFYADRLSELIEIKENEELDLPHFRKSRLFKERNKEDSLFEKCKNNYNGFCINGDCKYIVVLDITICLCDDYHWGERCAFVGL
ncbi:ORF-137 [Teiidae poxvirus 1]|nr:ORF-137 [Teiidae poxvirus 1]